MSSLRATLVIEDGEFATLFSKPAQDRLDALVKVRRIGGRSPSVPPRIGDESDILVTSWSTAPFSVQELHGARLRLCVHAGGSVRVLFPRDALGRGFRLVQAGAVPMASAVAEFALALSLTLLRNLHTHDRGMQSRAGWRESGNGLLGEALSDQRIGIVGFGRTGRAYAEMIDALGAKDVMVFDPFVGEEECRALRVEKMGLDELCARSDLLAIHAAATPDTHHLVGGAQLALLRDNAILVNTARSWVVDQTALLNEVRSGRLRAGLDVFDDEPLDSGSPFAGLPNVVLTPHVAGGTTKARLGQGDAVVEEIERYLSGQTSINEVTAENYAILA